MMRMVLLMLSGVAIYGFNAYADDNKQQQALEMASKAFKTPMKLDHYTTLVSVQAKPGLVQEYTYEITMNEDDLKTKMPALLENVKKQACNMQKFFRINERAYHWQRNGQDVFNLSVKASDC